MLKKFSDFGFNNNIETKVEETKVEETKVEENVEKVSEKVGNKCTCGDECKCGDECTCDDDCKCKKVEESTKEEKVDEDLLIKDGESVNIEILEDKIIKFNNIKLDEIMETLKEKYSDTDFFIRNKDNDLHVVKYNENLDIDINKFVDSLLQVYSKNPELKQITKGVKIKGNQNFSIVENMNPKFKDKFISDISTLLANKNK